MSCQSCFNEKVVRQLPFARVIWQCVVSCVLGVQLIAYNNNVRRSLRHDPLTNRRRPILCVGAAQSTIDRHTDKHTKRAQQLVPVHLSLERFQFGVLESSFVIHCYRKGGQHGQSSCVTSRGLWLLDVVHCYLGYYRELFCCPR
jgi:hypothetical protein